MGEPNTLLPVMHEVQAELSAVGGPEMLGIERYAFYERAKQAYAVIQTDERRLLRMFFFPQGRCSA